MVKESFEVPLLVDAVTSIALLPAVSKVPLKVSDEASKENPVGRELVPSFTAVTVISRLFFEQNGPTEKVRTSPVVVLLSSKVNDSTSPPHASAEVIE